MFNDNSRDIGQHVEPDLLVLFAESELGADTMDSIKQHLANCSTCGTQLEEIKSGVARYEEFHRKAYSEQFFPPPNAWQEFEAKLLACRVEEDKKSATPVAFPAAAETARKGLFNRRRIFPLGLAGVAAASVGLLFFVRPDRQHPISVTEILASARSMQARDLQAVSHPVVYQKLKIEKASLGTSAAESIVLETWHDIDNARLRESSDTWSRVVTEDKEHSSIELSEPVHNRHAQKSVRTHKNPPPLMTEIRTICQENDFHDPSPLSLSDFSRWSNSSPHKRETVQELKLDDDAKAYRITAETEGRAGAHTLRALQIVVRSKDWHAIQESFIVGDKEAAQTYEIAELDYRIIPLEKTGMGIWNSSSDETVGPPASPAKTKSDLAVGPDNNLLVDALVRLDGIDALTNDQISIERENGILKIHGLVASNARRDAILAALGSLAHLQNVNIDIRSMAETNTQQQIAGKPLEAQNVNVPARNLSGNTDLRKYLAATRHLSGLELEDEIQHFISTAFAQSSQAEENASAIRLLVSAVPESDQPMLTEKASEQWRTLIERHARNVRRQTDSLRSSLLRLESSQPGNPPNASRVPITDLPSQAVRLYKLSSENDRMLWDLLAPTSGSGSNKGLSYENLLQSLATEGDLAEAIARSAENYTDQH